MPKKWLTPSERTRRVGAHVSEVSSAVAEYVELILAEAPPLTDEQRVRLCELLRPVRKPVFEAAS